MEMVGGVNGERGGLAGGAGGSGGGHFRRPHVNRSDPLTPCLESTSGVSVDAAGLQQKMRRKQVRNPFVNIAISAKECKKKKKDRKIKDLLSFNTASRHRVVLRFFSSVLQERNGSPRPLPTDENVTRDFHPFQRFLFCFVLFLTWLFVSRPQNLTARSKNAIKTCSSCNQSRITAS